MAIANRRDRRFRQTFPGPDSGDNQQMLQDIKDTLDSRGQQQQQQQQHSGSAQQKPSDRNVTNNSERERERPESRDREQSSSRRSPPSEGPSPANASPGTTPRMQQNRTPTKQHTDRTKQQLAKIRRQIRPYHAYSDPGFHAARDKVNKKMLEHLISLGYNEVRRIVVVFTVEWWGENNKLFAKIRLTKTCGVNCPYRSSQHICVKLHISTL